MSAPAAPIGAVLLREAVAALREDTAARPGPVDVRRAIGTVIASHREIPSDQVVPTMWRVWGLVERLWAADGWPTFRSVEGWVAELRFAAGRCERLGGAA